MKIDLTKILFLPIATFFLGVSAQADTSFEDAWKTTEVFFGNETILSGATPGKDPVRCSIELRTKSFGQSANFTITITTRNNVSAEATLSNSPQCSPRISSGNGEIEFTSRCSDSSISFRESNQSKSIRIDSLSCIINKRKILE